MRHRETGTASPAEVPRADINVTPLVDVCLVLLIIFMVVTPMLRDGVEVRLPAASRASALPEHGQVVVTVRSDRSVWVDETIVGLEALPAALRRAGAGEPGTKVLLRGDRSLPYGEVRAVFKVLADAGIGRAALVTLRDELGGGS